MNIKVTKTEEEYNQALKKLEVVYDAPADTPEEDDAELLAIFNRKTKLTIKMIRNLHIKLKIPYESLIADYK